MGSIIVNPWLVAFYGPAQIFHLDVTGGFQFLRTQHVATLPCMHRQIQEPLIMLSFLPLHLIEISNSPIHFLELMIQHDAFRHLSLHTMHPFVHVQAFCR